MASSTVSLSLGSEHIKRDTKCWNPKNILFLDISKANFPLPSPPRWCEPRNSHGTGIYPSQSDGGVLSLSCLFGFWRKEDTHTAESKKMCYSLTIRKPAPPYHDVGDDSTRPEILSTTGLCLGDHLERSQVVIELMTGRDITSGAR